MKICALLYAPILLASFGTALSQTPQADTTQSPPVKKKVTSETDLPRFSYPTSMTGSALAISDDATFAPLQEKVRVFVDSILASYDIQDKATLSGYVGTKFDLDVLSGDMKSAKIDLDRLRNLQEKADRRATMGIVPDAILQAGKEAGSNSGPGFDQAFAADFMAKLNTLPWATVQENIKQLKMYYVFGTLTASQAYLKQSVDPGVLASQSLDLRGAQTIVFERAFLKWELPLRDAVLKDLSTYIREHDAAKPDIWADREVTLTNSDRLTPVRIAIWDSGVDPSVFPNRMYVDPSPGAHSAHGLAFDMNGAIKSEDLQPLTSEQRELYPKVIAYDKGLEDEAENIDSPEAAATVELINQTSADEQAVFDKTDRFIGQYIHGTHVAGIAVHGNPAARLVDIEFFDSLPEIPFAPTVAWANKFKADFAQVGDYLREHDVRVVNMSWRDNVSEIEDWLTKTSSEKNPEVRKQFAEQIYAIWKDAIEGSIRRAPNTLFVCGAGNSDSNAGFIGDVPASLHEPNLITVGAVDQAGQETSFTSYGDTVVVDADGFQVESYLPGGIKMKLSGTSMASPNVANLAAKLIAIRPALTPEQTKTLIRQGADTSADGRLHLINPKKSFALLETQKAMMEQ